MLDFGCGAGRVLREFLPEAESGEFWGCDLHPPTVAWLGDHLSPPLRFYVNDQIPMPHPDGYFDFIYAISVFTHITHDWSAWLLELHRILKPDGYLLATIIGPGEWGRSLADPPDENGLGMCVQRLGQSLEDTSGPRVLHSPWWLRSHWGRAFEIVSLSPVGFAGTYHGFVLGRKQDVSLTRNDLERHEPGDEREIEAQRLQLEVLEREAVERERSEVLGKDQVGGEEGAEALQLRLHVRPLEPTQVGVEGVGAGVEDLVEAIDNRLLVEADRTMLALGAAQLDPPVDGVSRGPVDRMDEAGAAFGADVQVLDQARRWLSIGSFHRSGTPIGSAIARTHGHLGALDVRPPALHAPLA